MSSTTEGCKSQSNEKAESLYSQGIHAATRQADAQTTLAWEVRLLREILDRHLGNLTAELREANYYLDNIDAGADMVGRYLEPLAERAAEGVAGRNGGSR